MSTFLVTGASGTVGKEVVRALLDRGETVKAASRHPEKSQQQFGHQVEAVFFDFENPDTFKEAEQANGVFLLEPPALDPTTYDLAVPFVNYLLKHGPKRLVYLSSHGMETLDDVSFHAQMEERLKQSNLDWRIVRPSFFMQSFGTYERENVVQRRIIFLPAGEGKNAFVSTQDVGIAVATLLVENQYQQQTFILTGSQAYTHFEVADMLSGIRGETIIYVNPDESTYRQVLAQAGVPDIVANYTVPLYGLIKNRKVEDVTNHVEQLTGRAPETLEEVLKRDFS